MIQIVIVALFPLISLIAFGYVLKKSNWLEVSFWRAAEKLNYYVLFPVMLFLNLAHADIAPTSIKQVSVVAITAMLGMTILLYAFKKYKNMGFARFGVHVQGILRFNTYIGLAVVSRLFHSAGMTIFAILLVLCIPLVNVISVLALTHHDNLRISTVILSLLKNPLILGCFFGGTYNISGLAMWTGIEQFIQSLAICSLPLGLMCVGAALQFHKLHQDIKPILFNTLFRLLLMPIFAYVICRSFDVSLLVTQVMVLFFALPTASASYVLTRVYGGDAELMASIISLQTVLATFSLPFVLSLII